MAQICHILQDKNSEQKIFKIFHLHKLIHDLCQNMYLSSPETSMGMPEITFFKKVHFVNLSFSLSGLIQDFLDHSPWFEYKSTPFWSAHVCGTPVLCYHDIDLIVGAFCEWGMDASPFCHIMRMLIMHVLPW